MAKIEGVLSQAIATFDNRDGVCSCFEWNAMLALLGVLDDCAATLAIRFYLLYGGDALQRHSSILILETSVL